MKQRLGRLFIIAIASLIAAGCTHNPVLGKWSITKREKEAPASYLDELSANVQSSTGATEIDFGKDSIVITSPTSRHQESGVEYSIQELEGGASDVRILQPRKGDTTRDIDTCHIDASGNRAQLESATELIDLARIQN
jgi:hypothetical protein